MNKYCYLVLSILLLGCRPDLEEGTIMKKFYISGHYETSSSFVSGNTYNSTYWVPECWYFQLEGKDIHGSFVVYDYPVRSNIYSNYCVGDKFRLGRRKEGDLD